MSACSRYVVITIQKGTDSEARASFNSAFFGIMRLVLMLVPLAIAFSWISPYIFGVPDINALEVQVMFALIFISALISAVATSFNTVFIAYNKLYCIYVARLVYTIVQVLLIVSVFSVTTPSVVYIGVAYLLSSFVLVGLSYILMRRARSDMRIRHSEYDRAQFRQMYSLGAWNLVQNVGTLLFIQMSLVITNITLGAEVQGGFSIVVSLISMVNTACYAIGTSVSPLLFREFSNGDRDSLIGVMRLALRFMAILMAMPIAFVLVFSPEILETWVGEEFRYLSEIVRIAFVVQLLYTLSTLMNDVPGIYLTVNRVGTVTLACGVLNVLLALVLVNATDLGVKGVMIAWAVSMFVLLLFKFVYNSRTIGAGWFTLLRPVLGGYVLMAVCTGLLYLLSMVYRPQTEWVPLILVFLVLFAVYFVTVYVVSFSSDEKRAMSNTLPSKLRDALPSFIVGRKL